MNQVRFGTRKRTGEARDHSGNSGLYFAKEVLNGTLWLWLLPLLLMLLLSLLLMLLTDRVLDNWSLNNKNALTFLTVLLLGASLKLNSKK